MNNIFLEDPYKKSVHTFIEKVSIIDENTAISFDENIYHPKGGGQPDDSGYIILNGDKHNISGIKKIKGEIFVLLGVVSDFHDDLFYGEELDCYLDWDRRYKIMRYHTAAHLVMSGLKRIIPGYAPKGMDIDDNIESCELRFVSDADVLESQLEELAIYIANSIRDGKDVFIKKYKNIDEAKSEGGDIFRVDPELALKGGVRTINIDSLDLNPCGGTHVKCVSEIVSVKILSVVRHDGRNKLVFSIEH